MKRTTGTDRLPRGVRLLHAVQKEPDWPAMTAAELSSYRDRANRLAAARLLRVITGRPDRGAVIGWEEVAVANRVVRCGSTGRRRMEPPRRPCRSCSRCTAVGSWARPRNATG